MGKKVVTLGEIMLDRFAFDLYDLDTSRMKQGK